MSCLCPNGFNSHKTQRRKLLLVQGSFLVYLKDTKWFRLLCLPPHPQMRLNLFGNTHRPFQVPHSYETKPYWLLFFIKKVVGSFFWNYTQYRVNWCCILQMGYMRHKIDIHLGEKNINCLIHHMKPRSIQT